MRYLSTEEGSTGAGARFGYSDSSDLWMRSRARLGSERELGYAGNQPEPWLPPWPGLEPVESWRFPSARLHFYM